MFSGGCQCGSVRYRLLDEPLAVVACHCTECQRQSGSAFSMSLIVSSGSLVLESQEIGSFSRVAESGREVVCVFCKQCGTRLVHDPAYDVPVRNVRAGTLDDTTALKPIAHTWLRSRQPWITIPDGVLAYETQPSSAQFIEDLGALKAAAVAASKEP